MTLIGDLFERDVTRTIPPVVYFHEQAPVEIEREVTEYIITGGYPKGDARAIDDGIHEQFVRLLGAISAELATGNSRNPACWISGYYGSGKSSFAKLLGLALDGLKLPDGKPLAEALIAQNHSPHSADFRAAWERMTKGLKPIAVVFDVGSKARGNEQVHSVVLRQVQERLGYSKTSNLVADYELRLEIEGLDEAFRDKVLAVHKKPWGELKDSQLVEDYFSTAIHALRPDLYPSEMAWVDSRSGADLENRRAPAEAVKAVQEMLERRKPGHTLFLVVDEVSQYVYEDTQRMLALQSFIEDLGHRLKGKAWLLATGQQKLEDDGGAASALPKLKDRFPPALRVHLGMANIREVVHKRLLKKKKLAIAEIEALFETHRADLMNHAYQGETIQKHDFVEVYPLLPGHVQLLLDITTGLRSRSTRVQGDAYAVRGLLQLLGDLFREKDLARFEAGRLVTIDLVYDVLSSALDPDIQLTLSSAFAFCNTQDDKLLARVLKAVAMLELVPERASYLVSADLVSRALYERLGQGNQQPAIQAALDLLVGRGFVGQSAKAGYRIESSAGQEWQRDREGYDPVGNAVSDEIQEALRLVFAEVDKVTLEALDLPWLVLFTDSITREAHVKDERKATAITVDLQLTKEGADVWTARSDNDTYKNRIVWVAGAYDNVRHTARAVARSKRMVTNNAGHESVLGDDRRRLLVDERNRSERLQKELRAALGSALLDGQLFFRGRSTSPSSLGHTVKGVLETFGTSVARALYPNPATFSVKDSDVLYLIDNRELTAPPPVLGQDKLGLLVLDAGKYEAACNGRIPTELLAYVTEHQGILGATLLAHFGAPPFGYAPDIVRACVIGLVRGGKVRVDVPEVGQLTSVRDQGIRELMKDGVLRKAQVAPKRGPEPTGRDRVAICTFFEECLNVVVARDNDAIADAVVARFAPLREELTDIEERFRKLPKRTRFPDELTRLGKVIESCRRSRQVEPTVFEVRRSLEALREGVTLLRRMKTDLSDGTVQSLHHAESILQVQWQSLNAVGAAEDVRAAAGRITDHLEASHPWDDVAALDADVAILRGAYRARRGALLESHAVRIEQTIDALKRRDGFDRLDPDQRHEIVRRVRAAASASDPDAVVPPLLGLAATLDAQLETAKAQALAHFEAHLVTLGESPTVELALEFAGREITSEAELDRFLDDLRRKILHELSAKHRVRLK